MEHPASRYQRPGTPTAALATVALALLATAFLSGPLMATFILALRVWGFRLFDFRCLCFFFGALQVRGKQPFQNLFIAEIGGPAVGGGSGFVQGSGG